MSSAKYRVVCYVATTAALLVGCERKDTDYSNEIAALQSKALGYDIHLAIVDFNVQALKHQAAEFNAATPGYHRMDSETGTFLISCEKVEPYLDGQKLTLSIGNLDRQLIAASNVLSGVRRCRR